MFGKRSKAIETEAPTATPVEPLENGVETSAPELQIEALEQRLSLLVRIVSPKLDFSP